MKCHELNWSGGKGEKWSSSEAAEKCNANRKKMLSTTKTYPCAKTTVVLMCKRKDKKKNTQKKKHTHTSTLFEKDAVIPLRMSWVRNPTGGDTHWSKLVLQKLCSLSLAYVCLEIPTLVNQQWKSLVPNGHVYVKTLLDPRVKLQSKDAEKKKKLTSGGKLKSYTLFIL